MAGRGEKLSRANGACRDARQGAAMRLVVACLALIGVGAGAALASSLIVRQPINGGSGGGGPTTPPGGAASFTCDDATTSGARPQEQQTLTLSGCTNSALTGPVTVSISGGATINGSGSATIDSGTGSIDLAFTPAVSDLGRFIDFELSDGSGTVATWTVEVQGVVVPALFDGFTPSNFSNLVHNPSAVPPVVVDVATTYSTGVRSLSLSPTPTADTFVALNATNGGGLTIGQCVDTDPAHAPSNAQPGITYVYPGTVTNTLFQNVCVRAHFTTAAAPGGYGTETRVGIGVPGNDIAVQEWLVTTQPAPDVEPDLFTLAPVLGRPLGAQVLSPEITLTGFNQPVVVSVTNLTGTNVGIEAAATSAALTGTYSPTATVNPGDVVRFRFLAASSNGQITDHAINVPAEGGGTLTLATQTIGTQPSASGTTHFTLTGGVGAPTTADFVTTVRYTYTINGGEPLTFANVLVTDSSNGSATVVSQSASSFVFDIRYTNQNAADVGFVGNLYFADPTNVTSITCTAEITEPTTILGNNNGTSCGSALKRNEGSTQSDVSSTPSDTRVNSSTTNPLSQSLSVTHP